MGNLHRCHCLKKFSKYEKTIKRYQLPLSTPLNPPPHTHTHTHIGQRVNECFHQYTAHYHFVSILNEIKCHLIFFHDVSVIIQRMQVILLNSLSINKNYSPTGSYFSPILLKIRIMFCSLGAILK